MNFTVTQSLVQSVRFGPSLSSIFMSVQEQQLLFLFSWVGPRIGLDFQETRLCRSSTGGWGAPTGNVVQGIGRKQSSCEKSEACSNRPVEQGRGLLEERGVYEDLEERQFSCKKQRSTQGWEKKVCRGVVRRISANGRAGVR